MENKHTVYTQQIHAVSPVEKKYSFALGKTLQFNPAVDGEGNQADCHDFRGHCVIFSPKEWAVEISDFRYQIIDGKKPAIKVHPSKSEQLKLAQLSERMSGKKIAIVYQGEILHVAKVRGKLGDDGLKLSFCDRHIFERIAQSLK